MNRNHVRAAFFFLVLMAIALVLFGCTSDDFATLLGNGAFTSTPKVGVIVNYDTATLGSYLVNSSTGVITEIATSPFATSMSRPWGVTIHPNGKWVYVADDDGTSVEAWSVNNSTGALTFINAADETNFVDWVTGIAISQDGKWVLTADCNDQVSVFAVNQTTGALTNTGAPATASGSPACLNSINVVNSKYVYVSAYDNTNMWAFSLNSSTGALTELPGSPFDLGSPDGFETQMADLTGKYLYAGTVTGDIYAATIAGDGSLTPIATGFPVSLSAGDVMQIAIDPRNKFLYAADDDHAIDGWSLNSTTGALTAIPGSPWDTGGSSAVQNVVVDPSGMFVYGSNWDSLGTDNNTAGFSINQSTGALTPIPGSPFPNTGHYANSMVITH